MNQRWRKIGAYVLLAMLAALVGAIFAESVQAHPIITAVFLFIFFIWWIAIRFRAYERAADFRLGDAFDQN